MALYPRRSPPPRRLLAIGAAVVFGISALFALGGALAAAFGLFALGTALLAWRLGIE
jgi:hypothetical protein